MTITTLDTAKCALNWLYVRWSHDPEKFQSVFDSSLRNEPFRNVMCSSTYNPKFYANWQPWNLSSLLGAPLTATNQKLWSPLNSEEGSWPLERVFVKKVALEVSSTAEVTLKLKYAYIAPFDLQKHGNILVQNPNHHSKEVTKALDQSDMKEITATGKIWAEVSERVTINVNPETKKIAAIRCKIQLEQSCRFVEGTYDVPRSPIGDNRAKLASMLAYWNMLMDHNIAAASSWIAEGVVFKGEDTSESMTLGDWISTRSTYDPMKFSFCLENEALLKWKLKREKVSVQGCKPKNLHKGLRKERQHQLQLSLDKITGITEKVFFKNKVEKRQRYGDSPATSSGDSDSSDSE